MNLLEGLNPEQQKAVLQSDGPVLILAGAGSGKTKTLTHRIAYLITEKKVSPYNILAVTFTNKAAKEMQERIGKLLATAGVSKDGSAVRVPWMGTFHRTCMMLLRRELQPKPDFTVKSDDPVTIPADSILANYGPNFTIYDEDDALVAIKRAMNELALDTKKFNPRAVKSFISGAKNELLTPSGYEPFAQGYFAEHVAKVYRRYQAILRNANAMDFDDIIMNTVLLLQNNPDILAKYQQQFRYIMVDEYQDTNHAQYKLIQLLAASHHNLCVVGDDYQCLVKGTLVTTDTKHLPIESVTPKTILKSANGFGTTALFPVAETQSRHYKGPVISIETIAGRKLQATPEHICYAQLQVKQNQWFVYLMYRADKGYRIGITKGVRNPGRGEVNGLMVRANQERADKMWILHTTESLSEARYLEDLLSLQYRIPTTLFYANSRGITLQQQHIDALFKTIDTRSHAKQLMEDFLLFEDYPHFRPQAVTSENSQYYPGRCLTYLIEFGDNRNDKKLPWHAHRIRVTTANQAIQQRFLEAGMSMRVDKKSKRIETSRKHFDEAYALATDISKTGDVDLVKSARLIKENKNFSWQPASHLRPGMLVPVLNGDVITIDEIKTVATREYDGEIYDLNITDVHNFAANDIIVHNSIYSWRGADFRNILNFEKDYPAASVIKLEQNYRSTGTILEAANHVIKNNTNRTDKKLWTENPAGLPITVIECSDERDEGDFIIQEIRTLVQQGKSYNDIAVLYRMNAQSRLLEEAFLRQSIPYRLIGALRFYERKEIKDVLGFLRYLANPSDLVSLERVINTPPRGIGDKTFQKVVDILQAERTGQSSSEAMPPKATEFLHAMEDLRKLSGIHDEIPKMTPAEIIDAVVRRMGYKDYIDDGTVEGESRWENIEELIRVASQLETLDQFLEEVALVADVDSYDPSEEAVILMTLHAAKGLEFPIVFMAGMEEGIFPHSRSLMDPTQMEEERRLCYVGMTRAKEQLYLIRAVRRIGWGGLVSNPKSRFLDELPEHLIDEI